MKNTLHKCTAALAALVLAPCVRAGAATPPPAAAAPMPFVYHPDPPEGKPYFDLLVPGSRDEYLTEARPKDHVWHLAFFFSWKFINGRNFWEPHDKRTANRAVSHKETPVPGGEVFEAELSYELDGSIEEKITAIVTRVYGGKDVSILPAAQKQIDELAKLGFGNLPICIAKTQYSFTDDPTKLGAPESFTVTVKNVKVSAGAGFLVVLTGDIMTMPGLPKVPAAERIDVDENGVISGLF